MKTVRNRDAYRVEFRNTGKVLFPGDNITKGDLIDYYNEVAPRMLPYLKDRPVVMQRFPDGIGKEGFYHKDVPDYFPGWIERKTVKKEDGTVTHVVCQNKSTLVYLANQGCITPHTWLSRRDKLDYPDQMIFDLDPPGHDFGPVRSAAFALRELLREIGLRPFVKTTGSSGLHVVCVLNRRSSFDEVRYFARMVSKRLVELDPENLTIEQRKQNRGNRVYIDTARNAYAQTAAPAYAVRPLPGAPISTPIAWDELKNASWNARTFHLGNIRQRLGGKEADPWEGMRRHARSLNEARRQLESRQADAA